jgi:hypothetical protein
MVMSNYEDDIRLYFYARCLDILWKQTDRVLTSENNVILNSNAIYYSVTESVLSKKTKQISPLPKKYLSFTA